MMENPQSGPSPDTDIDAQIDQLLQKYGGSSIDLGYLLCDQHTATPDRVALIYKEKVEHEARYTFTDLREYSTRFAAVLAKLGVAKGDRVATLLPKSPELVIAVLGIWRLGAIHVPLFTAFGPEAVDYRLTNSETSILIVDTKNRGKVEKKPVHLSTIVRVEGKDGVQEQSEDIPFWASLEKANGKVHTQKVSGQDPIILLYTSGTTGEPKGVEILTKFLAPIEVYMRLGLDLREDDIFWNMADPGWAYGLYYAIVGPLLLGHATILFNAPFDVDNTLRVLNDLKVTNLATSPTVFRVIKSMDHGSSSAEKHGFLRVASCAGEPLNPEVLSWGQQFFGISIRDQYGQTEVGMAVTNLQYPELKRPLKPGSAGPSMPGFRAVIVDGRGKELPPGTEGELAIDTHHSPLFIFKGYFKNPEKTRERFSEGGRYYLTGDAGSQDDEGYVFLTGRNDDVITSSGYRIGPYEIENVLMSHEAIGEVAVVGIPDQLRGELVKAFVVLKAGFTASESLAEAMRQLVKTRLSAHIYPREIAWVEALPKTPSGKVQRFMLRNQ